MATTTLRKLRRAGAMLAGAATLGLVAQPAGALDINGFSSADWHVDEACARDANCALNRGGVSDIMTVYAPGGAVFDRVFAFGNEEADNLYYFDPNSVAVDSSQIGNYTTLLEPNGDWSDTFGIANGPTGDVLAFISDPQASVPPLGLLALIEVIDLTPNPYFWEPGETWTIAYNATLYLSQAMRDAGYTADFRSDIPEPASLALLGIGALAAGSRRQKRT